MASYIGRSPSTTKELDDNEVTTAKINNSAVTTAKIADGTIAIADLSATGTKDNTTFLRGDNTFQVVNTDLSADTSPQLGGNLDGNGNTINLFKLVLSLLQNSLICLMVFIKERLK